MNILKVNAFNRQIASKPGHELYRYGYKTGYIAFEYRDYEKKKGLKSVYGKTKKEAIERFNT